MKLLAIDCSATAASVAVCEEDRIIASSFVNAKLTHSQTLLSMVENTLGCAKLTLSDIGAFAITNGPGSFTGIRIGISAVKGLAIAEDKPCIALSTLEAMAYGFLSFNCTVAAVMDARCNQVYNALFRIEDGVVTRLCEDRAISIEQLVTEIETYKTPVFVVGDGANLLKDKCTNENIIIAKEPLKHQRADSLALAARIKLMQGDTVCAKTLEPFYLRLPQAERELKTKKGE